MYEFIRIFLRACGNCQEQNKVLDFSVKIINYFIIINAYCNYHISNNGRLEECDNEERLAVTVLLLPVRKKTVKRSVKCHVLVRSPPEGSHEDKYSVNTSLIFV